MLAKDVKRGEMIRKVFDLGEVKDLSYKDENGEEIQKLSFTITSNRRDRDRDVVNPAGAIIDDYANNPVMLWAHQYTEFPIARSVEMTRLKVPKADGEESHFIQAVVEFQPDSNYHESYAGIRGSMVYKMYKTKFLNAVSIGFDPWEWEAIEEKSDSQKTPTELLDLIGMGGTHFTKWDMLEFSAVPVPSNPDALVDRKAMTKMLRTWATNTLVECERCSTEKEVTPVLKPYPNEHSCRLRDPGDFNPDTFRRTSRDHEGKKYDVIMGKLKGETTMTEQAYRYPKDTWDAASARSHCESHDGASFEAAKAEDGGIIKMAEDLKAVEKAGAVLSGANKTKLKNASNLILEVLASSEQESAPVAASVNGVVMKEGIYTISYPLGHEVEYLRDQLEQAFNPINKAEDVVPVVDDGQKPKPETFLIDEDELREALEHFGLDAQGEQGETLEDLKETTEE